VYDSEVSHLFEGSEAVVAGKYDGEINKIESSVTAQSTNGEMLFEDHFDLGQKDDHPFIERFWAYRKINYLLDRISVEGEEDMLVSEVVNISVNYSFVTPYTSLLIEVDDEVEGSGEDSGVGAGEESSYDSRPPATYNNAAMGGAPSNNANKGDADRKNPSMSTYGDEHSEAAMGFSILTFILMTIGIISFIVAVILVSRKKKKKKPKS
jgi:hypothetical protein